MVPIAPSKWADVPPPNFEEKLSKALQPTDLVQEATGGRAGWLAQEEILPHGALHAARVQ